MDDHDVTIALSRRRSVSGDGPGRLRRRVCDSRLAGVRHLVRCRHLDRRRRDRGAPSPRRHRPRCTRHGARLRHARRRPRQPDGRGRCGSRERATCSSCHAASTTIDSPSGSANCAISQRLTGSVARSSSSRSCRCRASASRSTFSTGSTDRTAGCWSTACTSHAPAAHRPRSLRWRPSGSPTHSSVMHRPSHRPTSYADALDGRSTLGDGGLPVRELVDALPDHTALSMEIRSAALRTDVPRIRPTAPVMSSTRRTPGSTRSSATGRPTNLERGEPAEDQRFVHGHWCIGLAGRRGTTLPRTSGNRRGDGQDAELASRSFA